jgi:hypothetical protein
MMRLELFHRGCTITAPAGLRSGRLGHCCCDGGAGSMGNGCRTGKRPGHRPSVTVLGEIGVDPSYRPGACEVGPAALVGSAVHCSASDSITTGRR